MTSEFDREIEAQDARAQEHMLQLLEVVVETGKAIKPLEDAREKAKAQLKQLMALAELDELTDHERGLYARIQHRNAAATFDAVRLVESVEGCEALVAAASAGMVRIDPKMLDRFRAEAGAAWADLINDKRMPASGGSDALTVGSMDDR